MDIINKGIKILLVIFAFLMLMLSIETVL